MSAFRQLGERPEYLLAHDFLAGSGWIDRNDLVSAIEQIFHCEIAGTIPVGRRADHGDGLGLAQDLAQIGVFVAVVNHGRHLEIIHGGAIAVRTDFDPDVTLKNRVVVAPMHQYSAVKGFATTGT
jgi:NADH:flavin oxidoreductases, Old Yellow Enzyme family